MPVLNALSLRKLFNIYNGSSPVFMTATRMWILVLFSKENFNSKGVLSGLTQFLATESPLTMMKDAFYFTSNAFFVLKKIKFLF